MSNWLYDAQQRLSREAPGFILAFIVEPGGKDFFAIGASNRLDKRVSVPCGPPAKQAVDEHLPALIELAKGA